MKYIILFIFCFYNSFLSAQQLQLHFDPRHNVAPKYNAKNFTTVYFEYFKAQDSGNAFIKPGSFLFKMQADLSGNANNIGKFYMQVSQSFRFWQPKIFLNLQYSGGLGVTEPKQYSYYIANTFSAGLSYPFKWGNAYLSSVLNYQYVSYKKPSGDFIYSLYWWKGFGNYKHEFAGDFSIWTQNRNHGDALTKNLNGKQLYFFAEPQYWYTITKNFAAGTKLNMYYHLYTIENILQVYPTIAVRLKL